MDGVIVDTEPVHHFAYQQHFKRLNIEVSPEMYASFTGNSTKNIYERLKSIYGLKEDVLDLVEVKRNLFNDAFDQKEDLYLLKFDINTFKTSKVKMPGPSSNVMAIFFRFPKDYCSMLLHDN